MTGPLFNAVEQLLADLNHQQAALDEAARQLAELSTTATAKNRAVAAVVNSKGELTELTFATSAYRRMAPAELAALIVETVRAARDQALAASERRLAELVPDGLPMLDLLHGRADLDDFIAGRVGQAEDLLRGFDGFAAGAAHRRETAAGSP